MIIENENAVLTTETAYKSISKHYKITNKSLNYKGIISIAAGGYNDGF